MKVLVTGAGGFIGSRLCKKLISRGHEVYGFIHEAQPNIEGLHIIKGDLTNENDIAISIISKSGERKGELTIFDSVIHLAAATPLVKDKKKQKKINYDGTVNLFNEMSNKTSFIIYASGLGVFGNSDGIIDEQSPIKPDTDFVKIRLEAQEFLEKSCKENNIGLSVCYFGDVYGDASWFTEMIVKRLKNGTFKIPGKGDYEKCFIHVDDAVGILTSVMEMNNWGEGKMVGDKNEVSTRNLSYVCADSTSVTFKEFVDYTADKIGTKHPGGVPMFLARGILGKDLIKLLTTPMKISNKKVSEIYKFVYPSYKEGINSILES